MVLWWLFAVMGFWSVWDNIITVVMVIFKAISIKKVSGTHSDTRFFRRGRVLVTHRHCTCTSMQRSAVVLTTF
jgi:hypothetical protein